MYKSLIRPILFSLSAEEAHHFTFRALKFFHKIPGFASILKSSLKIEDKRLERTVFGIKFPNPVGMAAGFDKDAKMVDEFASLGFGFIEIGTVTPKAQPGNDKPRLFRLIEDEAIINRMGFNNHGAAEAAERLKKVKSKVIIGGNIGKNKITEEKDAVKDYLSSFETLFPYVDYFVVNVSSPNTPGLRKLQAKEPLMHLLQAVQNANLKKNKPKPVLVKIAPDLNEGELDDIIEIINTTKIAGVIATNTTISRAGLKTSSEVVKAIDYNSKGDFVGGGLSGKPVTKKSTEVIRYIHTKSNGNIPIIAVGGIHTAEDAIEKLEAGASLIQLYTGFIYEGPSLIKRINKEILKRIS